MALAEYETLFRYFHILAGIAWIGLLYFFNLVNLPLLKFKLSKPYSPDMAEKATAHITIKTLFWFRWAAMFTLLFGLLLVEIRRQQMGGMGAYFFEQGWPGYFILIAVVLAIIMWINVWFIIWPNQQKILTNNKKIAAGASEDEKSSMQAVNAKALPQAVKASRFNTWASVPMLFGMVFGAHGARPDSGSISAYAVELLVLAVVLLLMVYYSYRKTK